MSRVEFSYGSFDFLLDRQVEGAIYAADVTLLKYFNLFDTNPARREPYNEVPLIPPADAFFTNNATAIPLPLTQGVEVTVLPKKTELQFKQLIMTFGSIAFTRTMVSSVDCLLSNIMPSLILALQAPKTAREKYCTWRCVGWIDRIEAATKIHTWSISSEYTFRCLREVFAIITNPKYNKRMGNERSRSSEAVLAYIRRVMLNNSLSFGILSVFQWSEWTLRYGAI